MLLLPLAPAGLHLLHAGAQLLMAALPAVPCLPLERVVSWSHKWKRWLERASGSLVWCTLVCATPDSLAPPSATNAMKANRRNACCLLQQGLSLSWHVTCQEHRWCSCSLLKGLAYKGYVAELHARCSSNRPGTYRAAQRNSTR